MKAKMCEMKRILEKDNAILDMAEKQTSKLKDIIKTIQNEP